jgi:hypothetical protein
MLTPITATLRYGRLSDGTGIPCAYALETDDGRSILFQDPLDWTSLAYHLGAHVDTAPLTSDDREEQYLIACRWLDANIGIEFNIAGSYDELLED